MSTPNTRKTRQMSGGDVFNAASCVSGALRARTAGSWLGDAAALAVSRGVAKDERQKCKHVPCMGARYADSVLRDLRCGKAKVRLLSGGSSKLRTWV